MSANLISRNDLPQTPARMQRAERIYDAFHVRVRGTNAFGEIFKINTLLDNISAGGLYLRLAQRVVTGAKLSIVVRFSAESFDEASDTPCMATRGVVLRAEPQANGTCGVAVAFTKHRFL